MKFPLLLHTNHPVDEPAVSLAAALMLPLFVRRVYYPDACVGGVDFPYNFQEKTKNNIILCKNVIYCVTYVSLDYFYRLYYEAL